MLYHPPDCWCMLKSVPVPYFLDPLFLIYPGLLHGQHLCNGSRGDSEEEERGRRWASVCSPVPLHPEHEPHLPFQHLLHRRWARVIVSVQLPFSQQLLGRIKQHILFFSQAQAWKWMTWLHMCVCSWVQGDICLWRDKDKMAIQDVKGSFASLRYCEAGGWGPAGASDPPLHSQRVSGWRLHLPGCFQTGLKCVTSLWTQEMLLSWERGAILGTEGETKHISADLAWLWSFERRIQEAAISALAEWQTVWLLASSA